MSNSLAIELRKFYMELVLYGFTEQQAFELTKMRVPEMEPDKPIQAGAVMAWTEALERWVTDVEKSEVKRAPVSRPAQAESIT